MQEKQNYDNEIDLRELLSTLWRGKYFIIIFTFVSLILASLYLRNATTEYEVSVLLAPLQTEQTGPNLNRLGGLASLAGISLPTSSSSDFTKYQVMLKSKEISTLVFQEKELVQELFSEEWDNNQQVFRPLKHDWKILVKNYVKELLTGQPPEVYVPPNPSRLSIFIDRNINIHLNKHTQHLSLTADTPNPNLIRKLMISIIENTDGLFKKNFIKQADDAVFFYQTKIAKSRSQEHREILATLIAKEERKLLLATRDGPFVAEVLTGPNTSLNPTYPKVKFVLALSVLIGIFLSFGLLLVRSFVLKKS